jgi:hypothetical protein
MICFPDLAISGRSVTDELCLTVAEFRWRDHQGGDAKEPSWVTMVKSKVRV